MIACDLGSNTLRIVELECHTFKRIKAYEKVVRTAKDLHLTHRIGEEAQSNIMNALKEASQLFDFKQQNIKCVTTEAMRRANNATEVLACIKHHYGLSFEIISGEEEAHFTSLAIEHALKREGRPASTYVLFDLGGGSTEIILCNNGNKISKSFSFGIVSAAEQWGENKNVLESIPDMMDDFLQTNTPIATTYQQLIATAGTPTTVASFLQGQDYAHYDYKTINGTSLHVSDFDEALSKLLSMSKEEAEHYTGTNRRDLVLVGITLVKAIMAKLGFDACIVMDDGLREGVAISNCNKPVSS